MSKIETKEVVVIGAGPGGYVAAIRLSQLGKKVTLIDKNFIGGVCLNEGCIPSKALIHVSNIYQSVLSASRYGITFTEPPSLDFGVLQNWKNKVVDKLTSGIGYLLKQNNIEFIQGSASFIDANTIEVQESNIKYLLKSEEFLIATGATPSVIPGIIPDGKNIITSREALLLEEVPQSMLIIGGGVIGVEIGTMYAKFGSKVTIVEMVDQLLPGIDKDLVTIIERNLKKKKVTCYTSSKVFNVNVLNNCIEVKVSHKDDIINLEVEKVLVATGRKPNTELLRLHNAGILTDKHGYIIVDSKLQTSVHHIYAIGDVTGAPQLAHKASKEGLTVAEVIVGHDEYLDYKVIPAVIFSEPEIASVGLSESEAEEKDMEIKMGKFPFTASGKALALDKTDGFVKVIADATDGMLLGVHIVGPSASELISEAVLAIETGCHIDDLALIIHPHPTLSESLMEAAEVLNNKGIHLYNPSSKVSV